MDEGEQTGEGTVPQRLRSNRDDRDEPVGHQEEDEPQGVMNHRGRRGAGPWERGKGWVSAPTCKELGGHRSRPHQKQQLDKLKINDFSMS